MNEKLQVIKAECQRLLALAEKRTPGKWEPGNGAVWANTKNESQNEVCEFVEDEDSDYIAACAGPAEAGWRATIAAIDFYLDSNGIVQGCLYELINEIITAWEGLV